MRPPSAPRIYAALLLVAVIAGGAAAQCPDGRPCAAPTRAAAAKNSVAVFPFASRSADTADVYLAEGIAEELATQLSRTGRLQVKAPSTAADQWRRTPEPIEAGKRLNVAWAVTGTVRRAGTQLLVNASLLRVGTAEQTWGARFPRTVADLFAVQAEVAESVTVAVVGRLAPTERATLAKAPTTDKEAYRLYLLGNNLLGRRGERDVRAAVAAYEQAVRLDPRFTSGWSRLATARTTQFSWANWVEPISKDSILKLARVAANRALALDSLSGSAWGAVATVAEWSRDLGTAQAAFARSVAIDSLDPEAWHGYGLMYAGELVASLLDYARGAPLFRRALALDPSLRNTWRHLGTASRDAGRLAEAEALLDTALLSGPWAPALRNRAQVRFHRGNAQGALADIEASIQLDSIPASFVNRAVYRVALGDSAPAREILARLKPQADSGRGLANYARIAMILGDRETALRALERLRTIPETGPVLCAPATPCSANLAVWRALHDPAFASLRGDPRVERLWEETRPRVPWLR